MDNNEYIGQKKFGSPDRWLLKIEINFMTLCKSNYMNTLFLTRNDFEAFITKKLIPVRKSSFNPTKTKRYIINLKEEKEDFDSPLFISDIKSVIVGNPHMIPQFVTLYGLPAGLFDYNTNNIIQTPEIKNYASKNIEQSETETRFLFYRRALLFANAWFIKSFDTSSAENALNYLVSEKIFHLLNVWVDKIICFGRYMEKKPTVPHLDDDTYNYQFIAMGELLKTYFFPDSEKIEVNHGKWLLNKCNRAVLTGAPDKFKGYEPLIGGYLIALKAHNLGQQNINFVLEKAEKFTFNHPEEKFEMIYASMFFIGLLNNNADNYFYASAATRLFSYIEQTAWNLANNSIGDFDFYPAFKEIDNAKLQPLENIINYYKTKNPFIQEKFYEKFTDHTKNIVAEKLYLLSPELAEQFLYKSKKIATLINWSNDNIILTKNPSLFDMLQQNKIDSVLLHHQFMAVSTDSISRKKTLLTDSAAIQRWLNSGYKLQAKLTDSIEKHKAKHLVLLSDKFHFDEFDKYFTKLNINLDSVESITFFIFFDKKKKKADKQNKSSTSKFSSPEIKWTDEEKIEHNEDQEDRAILQNEIESFFPDKKCRVISKTNEETPWEMVQLGIGVMKNVDFQNSFLLDLRRTPKKDNATEIILRCFHDVIVYDKDQLYIFMNLN